MPFTLRIHFLKNGRFHFISQLFKRLMQSAGFICMLKAYTKISQLASVISHLKLGWSAVPASMFPQSRFIPLQHCELDESIKKPLRIWAGMLKQATVYAYLWKIIAQFFWMASIIYLAILQCYSMYLIFALLTHTYTWKAARQSVLCGLCSVPSSIAFHSV